MNSNDIPSIQTAYYSSSTSTGLDFGNISTPTVTWTGQHTFPNQIQALIPMTTASSRRYVQVFICDPNENVPLEECLLYRGEPKLTDLTDQELFFEIDIKSALLKHNDKRVGYVDKSVKERTDHLEPARIRDLKMTVVTIASF